MRIYIRTLGENRAEFFPSLVGGKEGTGNERSMGVFEKQDSNISLLILTVET
jgi:hypothetical protein